jgi:hypothetical protein
MAFIFLAIGCLALKLLAQHLILWDDLATDKVFDASC